MLIYDRPISGLPGHMRVLLRFCVIGEHDVLQYEVISSLDGEPLINASLLLITETLADIEAKQHLASICGRVSERETAAATLTRNYLLI